MRAVDVRTEIVEAMTIDRRVRRLGIEMRGLDDADLRPRRQPGRRDVLPVRAFVARAPDRAVIRADPDVMIGDARRRNRIDHPLPRTRLRAVGSGDRIEIRRSFRIFAREIGADHAPMIAAVLCAEEPLIRKIEHVRIAMGENQRQRPRAAIVARNRERRIDRLRLHCAQIELLHAAAVENLRVLRIGGNVVALAAGSDLSEMCDINAIY